MLVMDREVDQMYGKSIILGVKKNRYFIPFYMKNKALWFGASSISIHGCFKVYHILVSKVCQKDITCNSRYLIERKGYLQPKDEAE